MTENELDTNVGIEVRDSINGNGPIGGKIATARYGNIAATYRPIVPMRGDCRVLDLKTARALTPEKPSLTQINISTFVNL